MSRVEISSKRVEYSDIELRMIVQTMCELVNRMKPKFKDFPSSYLCIDVETTGLSTDSDLITQIGYCLVEDRKISSSNNLILDWTRMPERFPEAKLRQKLATTKQHVEFKNGLPTGKHYWTDYEKLKTGQDPVGVLNLVGEMLEGIRADKHFIVAHNGVNFDCPLIEHHLAGFTNHNFLFGDNEVADSGMICKSSQINAIPWQHESIRDWSRRVYNTRLRGLRWALDTFCVPTYQLDVKHGLRMEEAHDAEFDAILTHHLFEFYRDVFDGKEREIT